uniref:PI3K/PI4K catalytic domain-containing protein n=1 Tax=Aureoumbra lagunensis TaxID=44058 RepID=A0A7S3JSQ7_9STRA
MRRIACAISLVLDSFFVLFYVIEKIDLLLAICAGLRLLITISFLVFGGDWCPKELLLFWCGLNAAIGSLCLAIIVFLGYESLLNTIICSESLVSSWFLWLAADWLRTTSRADTVEIFIYAGERFDHFAKHFILFASPRRNELFFRNNEEVALGEEKSNEANERNALLNNSLGKSRCCCCCNQNEDGFFQTFIQRSESIKSFWSAQLKREAARASKALGLVDETDFDLLIRLWAHEENILEPLFQHLCQNSEALAFFSLQLCGFLLFGAFWNSQQLRQWIIRLCQIDLRFAHRLHFFLRAWLPAAHQLAPTAHDDLAALQEEIEIAAGPLAIRLKALYTKQQQPKEDNSIQDVKNEQKTFTSINSLAFAETPQFISALTALSLELSPEKKNCQDIFKNQLEKLDQQLIHQTDTIAYLPFVGFQTERIVRIHVKESKLFITKERCPFLVCLELEKCAIDAEKMNTDNYFYHDLPQSPLASSRFFLRGRPARKKSPSNQDLVDLALSASSAENILGQWRSAGVESIRNRPNNFIRDVELGRSIDEDKIKPTVVFRERWVQKEARILGLKNLKQRRLVPIIVKANDDLRQEQFASQLIALAAAILRAANVSVQLRPYECLATGPDAGIVQALSDTVSLDALRRNDDRYTTLLDFFERFFGRARLPAARTAFIESLAPACIICYLLNLKDRHNGNILLDNKGRISHIDFGYMLASSPGGNIGFEAAPFKLTNDFLEVIGADRRKFDDLCYRSFIALRKHRHRLILLAEMTVAACDRLNCFDGRPRETLDLFIQRFRPDLKDRQCRSFVQDLIEKSINNWRTSLYDVYQRRCVGIY